MGFLGCRSGRLDEGPFKKTFFGQVKLIQPKKFEDTRGFLYESLNKNYVNSQINMKVGFNEYPYSDFIAKSLRNKLSVHQKVYTYSWVTKSKHNVKNKLHIYLKPEDDSLPDTKLLINAISYITSFSDKPRSITVHLCLLNVALSLLYEMLLELNLNLNP